MAKVQFSTENKTVNAFDFPKLKLKQNERARILLLEDPEMEYVHNLNAPSIDNGSAVPVTEKRKDGTPYETFKMDFISRPICLGDADVLANQGSDPKNCPICKLAKESDMAKPPVRRFALHALRYATKPGTFDVQTPFSVQNMVWAFTDKNFNKLVDAKQEWGDLRKHDLLLGPCTGETFQQFDIGVAAKAAWLDSKETQSFAATVFKENQAPDLSIFCGAKKERKWIEDDVTTIKQRWAIATGAGSTSSESDANLDAALDGLLDNAVPKDAEGWAAEAPDAGPAPVDSSLDDLLAETPAAPEESGAPADNLDDILGETAPAATPAKKASAKAAPAKEEPVEDIEDLLASLS